MHTIPTPFFRFDTGGTAFLRSVLEKGIQPVPFSCRREVLTALELALLSGVPQAGFFKLDWQRWAGVNPVATLPVFEQFMQRSEQTSTSRREHAAAALRELSPDERKTAVTVTLGKIVSEVLKIPVSLIRPDKSIVELGIDSLTAVELEVAILREYCIGIPVSNLLRKCSVSETAELILKELAD
ncbi:acyl carrier protein [bacterium]|nr:acyl carrier protein [bacterium]